MRVGVIAYLLHQGEDYRSAGVSIYTARLLEYLPRVSPEHDYVAFHGSDAPPLVDVESSLSPVPTRMPPVRIAWEQLGLPAQVLSKRLDVLHGAVNVLPVMVRQPTVVTVHDLSFLRHPEQFPRLKARYLRAAVQVSSRRADRVIAVSANTARDVHELLDFPPERTHVVHSGVDPDFREMPEGDLQTFRSTVFAGRPYVLHVGTLQPRKNIDVLIRAYGVLRRDRGVPHALALVGARGWMYQNLYQLVADERLEEDVKFIDYVPQEQLPLWYNCADLFVYPSAYEGFGFPVLEAMACGTPVVTSASSALVELAADACLTVEPGCQEALQTAMIRILQDDALALDLRSRGLKRAAHFRWESTARETAAVYHRALEDG